MKSIDYAAPQTLQDAIALLARRLILLEEGGEASERRVLQEAGRCAFEDGSARPTWRRIEPPDFSGESVADRLVRSGWRLLEKMLLARKESDR